jgi:hypothetical protein
MNITLQINLSAGDLHYAKMTVPALVGAHRASVKRILFVVDCCKPQRTKIVNPDSRFPEPEFGRKVKTICEMAAQWRAEGLCTDLFLLQPESDLIPTLRAKYLRNVIKESHDCCGCGLLSYLAGLELPGTRYVLHYDADVLLYQKTGYDWGLDALACMQESASIIAATPRISPPFAPQRNLPDAPSLHEGRPSTAVRDGWLNDWFSTRCFLIDKEKLARYLPLVKGRILWETLARKLLNRGYPCSPEIMLFRTVGGMGGRRLNLKTKDAWILHPTSKPDSYVAMLPQILQAVREGAVPETQCGYSEVNLAAWERFLSTRQNDKTTSAPSGWAARSGACR